MGTASWSPRHSYRVARVAWGRDLVANAEVAVTAPKTKRKQYSYKPDNDDCWTVDDFATRPSLPCLT